MLTLYRAALHRAIGLETEWKHRRNADFFLETGAYELEAVTTSKSRI